MNPAKFAKGLIFHIIQHALDEGWIEPGATVLDPFAGVALGALSCLLHSINWIGAELEPRFAIELGPQNLALWRERYGHIPGYGQALLLCGDSRNLCTILQGHMGGVVASPPSASSVHAESHGIDWSKAAPATGNRKRGVGTRQDATLRAKLNYAGETAGQLGTTCGDTFWSAARTILEQTYSPLAPGGHAIFVTKRYIRDGAIVDFTADWIRLCISVGFVLLHHHRAMLVEEHGIQSDLFEADTLHRTVRASFFRRLHMKKRPDLAIEWEDVTCWIKPGNAQRNGEIECCVSSPPYVHAVHDGSGIDQTKIKGNTPGRHSQTKAEGYGHSPGQLSTLPAGRTP